MPLSALPCSSPPCHEAVTALSGLGDVCVWKPCWGDEGSLDNMRGGGRQSAASQPGCPVLEGAQPCPRWCLPSLLQCDTYKWRQAPPPASLCGHPTGWKIQTPCELQPPKKESPRDSRQLSATTQAKGICVRLALHWTKQLDEREAEKHTNRQRERKIDSAGFPLQISSFSLRITCGWVTLKLLQLLLHPWPWFPALPLVHLV